MEGFRERRRVSGVKFPLNSRNKYALRDKCQFPPISRLVVVSWRDDTAILTHLAVQITPSTSLLRLIVARGCAILNPDTYQSSSSGVFFLFLSSTIIKRRASSSTGMIDIQALNRERASLMEGGVGLLSS